MKRPRVRFSICRMMIAVALLSLLLGLVDAMDVQRRTTYYRRRGEAAAKMERRCREIDAMDPVTRARESDLAFDGPLLDDPIWNRRMIGHFAVMKAKYYHAADNPRLPVPPDPPHP